jgi:hypothetical protein
MNIEQGAFYRCSDGKIRRVLYPFNRKSQKWFECNVYDASGRFLHYYKFSEANLKSLIVERVKPKNELRLARY